MSQFFVKTPPKKQETYDEYDEIDDEMDDTEIDDKKKPMIIIVTQDYSGLGWAKLCIDAGYPCLLATNMKKDEEEVENFNLVGNGIVEKDTLKNVMANKEKYRDAYFYWDGNHSFEEADILSEAGFKVLNSGKFRYDLEKDRKFGTDIAKKAGVVTPPTFEFNNKDDGMEFLDENCEKAYVFKPDDGAGCYTTYVPDAVKAEKANRELYDYLESQDGDTGTYILQERKDGMEVNIEYWVYKGKPFLAHANFECKRKENHDEGEMVGCAQDVAFIVPINCKLAKNTIDKLLDLPEFEDYTGHVDMNIIICDNEYYFLEYCCRPGYSDLPNVVMNLSLLSFPEIVTKWINGDVENFENYFRSGFGASITLRIDHPKKDIGIFIDEDVKFYLFDEYQKNDKYKLSGYGNEVGIVFAHDFTIQKAGEKVLREVDKINYPNHACRTDIDLENYESSPRLRKEAGDAMGLFVA